MIEYFKKHILKGEYAPSESEATVEANRMIRHYKAFRANGWGAKEAMNKALMLPKQTLEGWPHRDTGFGGNVTDQKRVIQTKEAKEMFRFVGYASDIDSLYYPEAYYISDDHDDTYKAVIYQIPAKDGHIRLIYGYEESSSDYTVLNVWDIISEFVGNDDCVYDMENQPCSRIAARAADKMAEKAAESTLEYDMNYQSGQMASEKDQEQIELRDKIVLTIKEIKGESLSDFTKGIVKEKIADMLEDMYKLRSERDKSFGYSVNEPWLTGFNDNSDDNRSTILGYE